MRHIALAAVAVAVVTLAVTHSARAETFTIRVKDGTPPVGNLPISRVKALFVGAYQPGVAVSINASEALAFPLGGSDVQATSINNPNNGRADQIIVRRINKDLMVQMDVSSLLDGLNPCAQADPTADASHSFPYAITLTGNAGVTAHGLVGYSAASSSNCGCKFRRRPTGVDWLTPPGASVRIPLSIMFVLDESGSMLSPPAGPGAGATSKWLLTREATLEFIDTLALGEPSVPDRLAMTFFDDTVNLVGGGAPAPWFAKANGGFAALKNELSSAAHPRSGGTSIGGGLKTGLEHTLCDGPDPLADPVVLLMSDGVQNTAPEVTDAAGVKQLAYSLSCPTEPAPSPSPSLAQACIPVLSVFVDQVGASPGPSLLQAIASQTAGVNASSAELISGPPAAFSNQLLTMLKGGTLSLLAKSVATMQTGQSVATSVVAPVDASVKRLVVALGWLPEHGNENALIFSVSPPGAESSGAGTETPRAATAELFSTSRTSSPAAAAAITPGRSPFHIVAAADLPVAGIGDWSFQVRRFGDGGQRAIPYHLFVYAVESKLQFVSRFSPGRHGTGEPLVLNLDLSLDRQPFKGPHDAIRVSVDGPSGAIGTLLHNLKDPGGPPTPGEADRQSAADKKIQNVSHDPAVLEQTLPKSTGQVLSFASLGEGMYQVKLNQTRVPGTYVFHLTLDIAGPSGSIHRVEDVETQVEVLPDASQIVVSNPAAGVFTVQVVPQDHFGNFLGPGFGNQVQLRIPPGGGKLAGVGDTDTTGVYTLQVADVPPGVDPFVELVVAGSTVARGPLSQLKPIQPGIPLPHGGGCCGSMVSAAHGGRHATLPLAVVALAGIGALRRRSRRS